MNLEDFKSFRRALIPSEVGSIPTHSRHFRPLVFVPGVMVIALAIFVPGIVRAQGPGPAPEVAPEPVALSPGPESGLTTFTGGPSALQRAMRSAVVPAWGQLTNGKKKKAAVLFGAQAYIYTRIAIESRQAREADLFAAALQREGAHENEIALAETWAQDHYDTRRDLLFWAIVAGFYGAMDAYIDAHIGEFDREIEEGRTLFARVGQPGRVCRPPRRAHCGARGGAHRAAGARCLAVEWRRHAGRCLRAPRRFRRRPRRAGALGGGPSRLACGGRRPAWRCSARKPGRTY